MKVPHDWVTKFESGFPERLSGKRLLGREAEYLVANADGTGVDIEPIFSQLKNQLGFSPGYDIEDSSLLVSLEGVDYTYAREVGKSTIEIILRPVQTLFEMEELLVNALRPLDLLLKENGLSRLGVGVLPKGFEGKDPMTQKGRYKALQSILGDFWNIFSFSASDQTHISVARDEVISISNLANELSSIFIALAANSNIFDSKLTDCRSLRERVNGEILSHEKRYGDPYQKFLDLEDYLQSHMGKTFLIRKVKGKSVAIGRVFSEVMGQETLTFQDFLDHEHYVWHTARPRSQHGTVEVRPICQQPWEDRILSSTLVLGLLDDWKSTQSYLEKEMPTLESPQFRLKLFEDVLTRGMNSSLFSGQFFEGLVDVMERTLKARGFGEERFLSGILARINTRMSPADVSEKVYKAKGLDAAVDAMRI